MAATTLLFADNASTTLAASITASATTCTLAPGTGAFFPNPGANQAFAMSFVDAATGLVTEIVKVTAISGDTVTTMVRGQEGTAARAWLAGDLASNFWTAGNLGAAAMAQVGPVQQGAYGYAVDSGSANTIVLTLVPAITSYVDGITINFKAAANNTSATTININGIGAVALQGAAGGLQGGEIVAGKMYEVSYNSTGGVFVILAQGGGAKQVVSGTASEHAPQMVQVAGIVGSVRNLVMNITAASSSAVMSADEIIVETALGGVRYCMYGFAGTINLATTGVGGMDTGSPPVSGYVGVYAILNPTTGAWRLLATNATSAAVANIYSGTLPTGYTASALVSVWPTNASGQFVAGYQADRTIAIGVIGVLSSSTSQASPTALSISAAVPKNARSASGTISVASTAASNIAVQVMATSGSLGIQGVNSITTAASGATSAPFRNLLLSTQQSLYYTSTNSAGTPTFTIAITGYDF